MAGLNGPDALESFRNMHEEVVRRGRACSFKYGSHPHQWYDQFFQRDIAPTGKTLCEEPLRVGSVNNRLDVAIVCSYDDDEYKEITVAAGSKITVTLHESDEPDGVFVPVGPTICVTAPTPDTILHPGELVARFPIGNMNRPWCKAEVEFDGGITGGNVDVLLSIVPY